ncbi:rhombosortase [Enterovibrio nigricans]|uniref:Rhomboid family GlyGly-CTERM serine protease n=1 Tax=Enterovibrio nigricans DSM 22720 TaxID=1121868 RepID=A0A1T4USD0_9GAMM|nr:rhombosortase [Enterovibrio nigricans]SKA55560.1 rhomboid family GlyGly-CTERM serine protease [Enterovibrio nigricans DSM 22720]
MSVIRILCLIVIVTLIAQIPVVHQFLVWERTEILAGQWWRIVTGNITHTNLAHIAMNLSALVIITFLHRQYYQVRSMVIIVWCMMLVIGLVMFISPYDWYAGLSGVLHGLFVWGVVRDIQNKVPLGWPLLVGVFGKMSYEAYNGGDALTAQIIEAGVAYQAHWAGAIVGLMFALLWKPSGDALEAKQKKLG